MDEYEDAVVSCWGDDARDVGGVSSETRFELKAMLWDILFRNQTLKPGALSSRGRACTARPHHEADASLRKSPLAPNRDSVIGDVTG